MVKNEPKKGQFSIVMEYGKADIATALLKPQIHEMKKLSWLKESCDGVRQLHNKGMVWTDLKAENFVLFEQDFDSVVKCIDLDCCVLNGQYLVGYTAKRMPPEFAQHLQGKPSPGDKKAAAQGFQAKKSFDMWGLGLYIWRIMQNQEFHDDCYKFDETNTRVFDEDQCIEYLCQPELQAKINARIATVKNPKVSAVLEVLLRVDPSERATCSAVMDHSLFHHSTDATQGVASKLRHIGDNVTRTLATALAMANDELKYPSTFMVLPVPSKASKNRSLARWFKAPDRWCNDEYVPHASQKATLCPFTN
jgi:serine/threonine protein kinase